MIRCMNGQSFIPPSLPLSLPPSLQSQAWVENKKNPQPRFKLVQRPERPLSGMSKPLLIIAVLLSPKAASLLTQSAQDES